MSASSTVRENSGISVWSWLTNTSVAPAWRHEREQQLQELLAAVGVERRRGLVGDDHFGRADQRARRRDALLLAHAQLADRRIEQLDDIQLPRRYRAPPHRTTRDPAARGGARRGESGSRMFSRTDRYGMRLNIWNT